jgi:septum formation protein
MISPQQPLLLGSASPRRRQLLEEQGLALRVLTADVDESVRDAESPPEYLERVVAAKLTAIARQLVEQDSVALRSPAPTALLVADTAVVAGRRILGKPADLAEAEQMVASLLGSTHEVMTRYALSVAPHFSAAVVARTVVTEVTFAAFPPQIAGRYAASAEGLDKAGAYAIQGLGAFLVESIRGSWSNVVGLPVSQVITDLMQLGLVKDFPGGVEGA